MRASLPTVKLVSKYVFEKEPIKKCFRTGSGKSYTMMGTEEDKGIIPRICETMFSRIDEVYYVGT